MSKPNTLAEFLDEYTSIKDIRTGTIRQYEYVILSFRDFLEREPLMADFNRQAVNGWLKWLQDTRDFSPFTLKSRRITMLSIWRLAAELEYVDPPRSLFIRKVKLPDRQIETITIEDVHRIIALARRDRRRMRGFPWRRGDYFRSAIMAIMETSLRTSDLHRLDFTDVMKADGHFPIIQVKTGHRRWVRMSDHLLDDIRSWHPGHGLIWPRVCRNMLRRELNKLGQVIGKHVTPTILRKTAITMAEQRQPGSGWIFAGHKGPETTRLWYTDADLAYRDLPAPDYWS